MKKIIYIAFIALGLCACDNKDEFLNTPTPETTKSPVAYHFSLQASFDAQTRGVTFDNDGEHISSQFEDGDKIYVYNETKGAFARSASDEYKLSYLQPTNISGSSCTLVGDLSFYLWDDNNDKWEVVTVDATDTYSLYYQMNDPNYYFSGAGSIPRFDWSQQDGSASAASNCDFAEAKGISMTLTGSKLTVPSSICFQNLQSMFRQRLSFSKNSAPVTPSTITKLTVGTKNSTLLEYYRPDRPDQEGDNGKYWEFNSYDIYDLVITSDGDIYLSLAFYYTGTKAEDDQLILTAVDNEGNVYQGTKDVPIGGFQKSKYYYGSCELEWQYKTSKPILTRSDGGDPDELIPDVDGLYDIYPNGNKDIKITISGYSEGFYFWLNNQPAEVTLAGNGTAISTVDNNDFIYADENLTIILGSDYSITSPNNGTAIWSEGGDLKLKTTGAAQKLIVTTNDDGYSGIYGDNNYDKGNSRNVSALAADEFAVSCSPTIDNGDGTYTWTYTVSPKPNYYAVTDGDLGKVIGADGNIYENIEEAMAASTTAEAMIAYVGSITNVCSHGLAISLTDAYGYNATWDGAKTVAIPEWATAHPVPGGTWRLPSEKEWQYMLWGYYNGNPEATNISIFNTKLTTAGGTALPTDSYFWTSTEYEYDNDKAHVVYQDNTSSAGIDKTYKTENWHVRACLSF
jgi:hypothetical protein